jgi:DNA recombination protein RmuC
VTDTLLLLVLAVLLVNTVLAVVAMLRRRPGDAGLAQRLSALESANERAERTVREELARSREEAGAAAKRTREELSLSLKTFGDSVVSRMAEIAQLQRGQIDTFSQQLTTLTQSNEQRLDKVRETVEAKLLALQTDNAQRLEQMRATVDEKLHATLEMRLSESFKRVSERLEAVHAGLGEMRSLATGVGDLKRVLTNIRTRGSWGEVTLGNLLEQILTPDQYAVNVATNPETGERVEFAIRLPGRDESGTPVWLPIDSKFPREDHERLLDAQERGDADGVAAASDALAKRVRAEALKIREKYVNPPGTTDFAIMFLATEGLFAEVLRRPGLCDGVLHDHRVVISGPTTLAAVLSSLQMGFRTLAIEKRSSEVWTILGAVKTEFAKFAGVLDKVQKKLQEASNTIDDAARRSRVLERKLKGVEELSGEDAAKLLETTDALAVEERGEANEGEPGLSPAESL